MVRLSSLLEFKDDKPEVPSHNPSMFIILWDVKEPAHLSQRVGHVVPGVVVCLLWYIMAGRVKRAHLIWNFALLCDPHHSCGESYSK